MNVCVLGAGGGGSFISNLSSPAVGMELHVDASSACKWRPQKNEKRNSSFIVPYAVIMMDTIDTSMLKG